jgi:hypothetical protein
MSIGFKMDCWLGIVVVTLLQLWPAPSIQAAVKFQIQSGYVAGWSSR